MLMHTLRSRGASNPGAARLQRCGAPKDTPLAEHRDRHGPVAASMARLSALTALTSLHMQLSGCYMDCGDSWYSADEEGHSHDALEGVREAHLAALVSALRRLPQLQHLACPRQSLRPEDVIQLSGLTSLTLAVLLSPAAAPPKGAPGWPLPPQLRELILEHSTSPLALAALQPSPSLALMRAPVLRFGMSHVTPVVGRLTAEAMAAVGPAVRLLVDYRDPAHRMECIRMEGDGAPHSCCPGRASLAATWSGYGSCAAWTYLSVWSCPS